jgi:hypothetical protein
MHVLSSSSVFSPMTHFFPFEPFLGKLARTTPQQPARAKRAGCAEAVGVGAMVNATTGLE